MNPVKLITLYGEWTGLYKLEDDHYVISIETHEKISFDYGVLLIDSQSVPVPVMYGRSSIKKDKLEVICYRFADTDKQVYTPYVDDGYYIYRVNKASLDMFVEHGAATSKIIDKVLLCPQCNVISFTIRPGCVTCGSHNIRTDQLVHHYACGNVNYLEAYTISHKTGTLACNKCHKDNLIINVDYDVSAGLKRCMDCGWSGSNAKLIGRCLCCGTDFLVTEAGEMDLMEYTVL